MFGHPGDYDFREIPSQHHIDELRSELKELVKRVNFKVEENFDACERYYIKILEKRDKISQNKVDLEDIIATLDSQK